MKMDTSLLQSDPEALDQIPKKYQDNDQLSFLIRIQKNIRYHRFVQIIKLILYLQLIFAIAAVGCITLSNYYSGQRSYDNAMDPPEPASDRNGEGSRLNLESDPAERISWRTKEADTIVSTERRQNPTESAKFVVIVEDFEENEKPTSFGNITFEVSEDNQIETVSDLSKIKKVLDNLDKQARSPFPDLISETSSSKIDDIVASDKNTESEYISSVDLDDDQIIQLLIEKLLSEKAVFADTDISSDSKSSAEETPSINLKSKRSAESSSSESSSSSSSSSESGDTERPPVNLEAAMEMLAKIISQMDKSDCEQNSNGNSTSNGDSAERARFLRKRLVKGIAKAPKPDCGGSQPTLSVDLCGNLSYVCPFNEFANKSSDKHAG